MRSLRAPLRFFANFYTNRLWFQKICVGLQCLNFSSDVRIAENSAFFISVHIVKN